MTACTPLRVMEFDAAKIVVLVLTVLAVVAIFLLRRHAGSGTDDSGSDDRSSGR